MVRAALALCALSLTAVNAFGVVANNSLGRLHPSIQRHLSRAAEEISSGNDERGVVLARAAMVPRQIRVSFSFNGVRSSRKGMLLEQGRRALKSWNEAIGAEAFVEASGRADIRVIFQSEVYQGSRRVAGLTSVSRGYNSRGDSWVAGEVAISDRGVNGAELTGAQVRKILMHEFGHVAGLDDVGSSSKTMGSVRSDERHVEVDEESKAALRTLQATTEALLSTASAPTSRAPVIFKFPN